jgi:hypothetical protein
MKITYKFDIVPTTDQIIALYNNSGLPRPTNNYKRITK